MSRTGDRGVRTLRGRLRPVPARPAGLGNLHGAQCSRCGIDYTRCAPADGVDVCVDCHDTEAEATVGGGC